MKKTYFSQEVTVFHGRIPPEPGFLAGYGAIIEAFSLQVPVPHTLALISKKNRRYEKEGWIIFGPKYQPEDNLYKQLVFALKYEGINLLVFKHLFHKLSENDIKKLLQLEPTGQYSRRIWFLYEWLMDKRLQIPDLTVKNFVPLLDENKQYAVEGIRSSRHRIVNNLPGTRDFCPLITKTPRLEKYVTANFAQRSSTFFNTVHKDILQRASAFLLLKDSKASFTIEGESPPNKRAAKWGKAIGQAGSKRLSKEELLRLQQIVIESTRFTTMGFRREGGFVGEHDRTTGEPLPDHISARWQDIELLIDALLATNRRLEESDFDAVLAATMIAFGFVFVHPFEDGNGRIHRYLIHHILAEKKFAQQGIIFPVSASILDRITDYRRVLEAYSQPLLDFIEWRSTPQHNVEVLNETADYYRYFNVTKQAEFLYECVEDTIVNIIPNELKYLRNYDEMKSYLEDRFEMPDRTVALLVRFLDQNDGQLSKRARSKEFNALTEKEVTEIEDRYNTIFIEK